jgi:branched-chain amino acid transport system permease protein
MIEDILINGAMTSGTLALLALGFTLIYGVADVVNMSHGALYMLGAYLFFVFTTIFPIDLLLAFVLAVVLTGIIGATIYRLAIHPVVDDLLASLVITVGVTIIIQELTIISFGSYRRPVPSFAQGFLTLAGVKVPNATFLAFVVSLILFGGLWTFLAKVKIGKAMRAVAQDHEVAMLMGINTERLYMLTMGISATLAALAGVLITASTTRLAYPHMWDTPLYLSFSIVILGGLGSVKGTLVGALIVGYAEEIFVTLSSLYLPGGGFLKGVVAMAIMMTVLILRPKGLFGKRIEMEE